MAGTIIDMSKIKQLLHLKKAGVSNRQIAKDLKMSRDKANEYVNRAESDPLGIDGLLKLDDPVLEKRFHPGNPAYTDERMETFLELLPDFVEQLSHKHVTRQLVWEDYKRLHPDGYEKSQFYFHLAQNLKAQKTEDFLHALGKALEFYGGVPRIVVPDNLKAAVIKADKYEPVLNKAMDDMGNHYGFVTIPCQPVKPTQKAKVENQVQIIYHRIYARLRNRQFFSLKELNAAVSEFLACHNQTRMQQRPYTREEHFHAVEKPELLPLPETPYQMKRYAEVTVQQNGHVYLSCDKHYYSVPYTLIGCKAKMIFGQGSPSGLRPPVKP